MAGRRWFALKMPEKIDAEMFAPCGMNCMVCFVHCKPKAACGGCMGSDEGKPGHCRNCVRTACAVEKGLTYCYECGEFPCRRMKDLDRSYRKRYGVSLIEQADFVKENGIDAFMEEERKRYMCPDCGGVITVHDKWCSECKSVQER